MYSDYVLRRWVSDSTWLLHNRELIVNSCPRAAWRAYRLHFSHFMMALSLFKGRMQWTSIRWLPFAFPPLLSLVLSLMRNGRPIVDDLSTLKVFLTSTGFSKLISNYYRPNPNALRRRAENLGSPSVHSGPKTNNKKINIPPSLENCDQILHPTA